ncbi:DUF4214 domain-containing protein [Phaeobacter sp. J2-8]|uniref:DUF4214 domain-containing protein n=1 Tax=Phaeobacter sp. J2-8 TaxID=2931394 RepID=UPI001FD3C9CE|nr:DUF4214 domain-containing protein [Phaeobacter sp. J2-8]MCJ7874840.1 DUF4214 domain-containing protein [Phaeobacter sp. J2-8]
MDDFLFPEVYAPDALEAVRNDTLETAQLLGEGSFDIDGLGQDWYRIESQAGFMRFAMTPGAEPLNLDMELYDSNGNRIQRDVAASGMEDFDRRISENGTYYLRVFAAPLGDNPPSDTELDYRLDIDLPQVVVDANDSMATATDLGAGGSGDIVGTGVDWWRVTSPSGMLNITMTTSENLDDPTDPRDDIRNLNMEIYNSAGQVVKSNFSTGVTEDVTYLAPSDGDYYVKIYAAQFGGDPAPDNVVLSYSLNVDLPEVDTVTDNNDTITTATPLGEGHHVVTDGIGTDWYRIDSPAGIMNFHMAHTGGLAPDGTEMNLNMRLYDADGNPVRNGFAEFADESFEYQFPTAATYYLNVYWAPYPDGAPNGTRLNYELNIDLPDAVASDGNDTFATAMDLPEGVARDVVGTGVDWWKVNSAHSGLIEVSLTAAEHLDDPNDLRDDLRNLNIEIYNSAGELVRSNFSDDMTETVQYLAPVAGEYYFKVYTAQFRDDTPENVLLSYTINYDLPGPDNRSDGNDTRATAERLRVGEHIVTEGIGTDWYEIQTGPGRMDFEMTHTGATTPDGMEMNLNMRLYDADGNPVRSDYQEFTNEAFEFYASRTSTYYLNVFWAPYDGQELPNGVSLNYELNVALPRKTWSNELDFGPIRNASVAVYDIDGDGKDEIFVGTVKGLDGEANEVLPAGLVVLEDTGGVKWSQTFEAMSTPDPVTGKIYNTTSVSTAPVFSDLDNDGSIDIVVGVGADNRNEFAPAGQPGDKGGIYALDSDGNIMWSYITKDSFGRQSDPDDPESPSGPDGRPDGVYGTPRVFDIDADGQREVIFSSWDHYLYVLDGATGELEFTVDLHDTAGATPALADLDGDGLFEIIAPADITENARAGIPIQGGILHVLNNYGHQTVAGWDTQVGTSTNADFRGKLEEQSLWSSPKVVDLDNNGTLEIVQGTGNFFQDERGEYVKVWNTDGSLRFQLDTRGRVLASPLIADLDGNGSPEIIAATLEGYVHAWSAGGGTLFSTQVMPFDNDTMTGLPDVPIARQPIAVDLTGDGNLEIMVSIGSQMIVLDQKGNQITNTELVERAFNNYAGSPVAHDIDNDGYLDLITGGTNADQDHAVVYRWENIVDTQVGETRIAEYQNSQSLHEIQAFVEQMYDTILGRDPDANGLNNWTDRLYTGVRSGADVARGFIFSPEFLARGLTNEEYVEVLYEAFFGRKPDAQGFARWTGDLDNGLSRDQVLQGFTGSPQFANLSSSYGIRAESKSGAADDSDVLIGDLTDSSVLRGGDSNQILKEGTAAVDALVSNGKELTGQVYRLYGGTLGREPDATGFTNWYDGLVRGQNGTGGVTLLQAANAFVNSAEFQLKYGTLDNAAFVTQLYRNVLGREPDATGLANWTGRLESQEMTRAQVVLGFAQAGEFRTATNPLLDQWMYDVRPEWNDVLEGGAGDDQMNGRVGSDTFVFRNGQGGSDVIHGFEPWDRVQLSGFGFNTAADAMAHMTQVGGAVVFDHAGQVITFRNTSMADMQRVGFNVS